MPNVKGRVIEVPAEPNAPLKQGDVLFKIDPTPYQYVVDQKKALLAEAETAVYTPYAHHFALIRKILLRMRSWENFVFLEGHGGGGGSEGGH
jgi:multidrug resistance efflux pump